VGSPSRRISLDNQMKIFVKAKAGAREEKIEAPAAKLWKEDKKDGAGEKEWFKIWVKEPPAQGRANESIAKLLAKHFKISPSQVRLLSGASSKQKAFEILV
jgi:uncharacterized protein YggU (UPF0235/DUF167 family)